MCVQNQKSIAPFPSSTNFYKFRHDGSIVYCFIVNSTYSKSCRVFLPNGFVRHYTAAWPFTTFATLPMNFSPLYITTTQLPPSRC